MLRALSSLDIHITRSAKREGNKILRTGLTNGLGFRMRLRQRSFRHRHNSLALLLLRFTRGMLLQCLALLNLRLMQRLTNLTLRHLIGRGFSHRLRLRLFSDALRLTFLTRFFLSLQNSLVTGHSLTSQRQFMLPLVSLLRRMHAKRQNHRQQRAGNQRIQRAEPQRNAQTSTTTVISANAATMMRRRLIAARRRLRT